MKPKSRWMSYILHESATLQIAMPWERQVRHMRRETPAHRNTA